MIYYLLTFQSKLNLYLFEEPNIRTNTKLEVLRRMPYLLAVTRKNRTEHQASRPHVIEVPAQPHNTNTAIRMISEFLLLGMNTLNVATKKALKLKLV